MAKLTEPEQQEIARFIAAGKPLPDKYRFLLFEDKREVELVWNGKTGEVCNSVTRNYFSAWTVAAASSRAGPINLSGGITN